MNEENNNMKYEEKIKKSPQLDKRKIFLFLGLIIGIIYIIYTIYLLIRQPTNVFVVEEGKLYQEETNVGYVIRNEKIVKGQNYKNGMEQIKTEGERAAKNENIYRYYSADENNLKQKIEELDQKIQEVMSKEENLYTSDMRILEKQIDEKLENIYKVNDYVKLAEYKKEIDRLVTKKAKIAGDSSPKGSYLRQLIEERKKYENKLNSGAEYVKAPISGIVSYRVDGLEEKLTPDKIGELDKKSLDELDLKTGKIVATNEECGKVIDNFEAYIITISKSKEAKEAKVGERIKVRLSNNVETSAKIVNLKQEENGEVVIALQIDNQIKELINYRKITFDLIWWSATGLKVPNQAIVEENGKNYVVRNRAGYLSKILVKVSKKGNNYSIVEPYKTEELREMGLSEREIINKRKISMYDEILIKPNLNKVQE